MIHNGYKMVSFVVFKDENFFFGYKSGGFVSFKIYCNTYPLHQYTRIIFKEDGI